MPTELAKEVGSDGSAAGGGRSDLSEWPRSVCEEAVLSATRAPGTATVQYYDYKHLFKSNRVNTMKDHPIGWSSFAFVSNKGRIALLLC